MKLRFFLIGKAKEKYFKEAFDEYLKRLSKYGDVSIDFIPETDLPSEPSDILIKKALDEEASKALKNIKDQDCLFLLDLHGKQMDSETFASLLKDKQTRGRSSFVFLVGSSYGLSDLLRKRADVSICFSQMTMTHPLTLLVTLEQVYRAMKINNGETYHK
jgi:23S rRNA (pseudouridine1915-N3)-methyltransferase